MTGHASGAVALPDLGSVADLGAVPGILNDKEVEGYGVGAVVNGRLVGIDPMRILGPLAFSRR